MRKWLICFCLFCQQLAFASPVLKTMDGQSIEFVDLKGQWVFINYWASWCAPCLKEIGALNKFFSQRNQYHAALFAVNYDEVSLSKQKVLAKQYHIKYPSLRKDPASVLNLGDIRGVPATFIFNPEGNFHTVLYGAQTVRSLRKAIGV